MDIQISALPFGGRAFEPVSEAGRDWLADITSREADAPYFRYPDACMAGFDGDAIGVEPYDFEVLYDELEDAKLISNLCREWKL